MLKVYFSVISSTHIGYFIEFDIVVFNVKRRVSDFYSVSFNWEGTCAAFEKCF